MRIVVSGTHASGKSTLIEAFAARHPEYRVLPDPFEEVLDDGFGELDAGLFERQLEIAARRLIALPPDSDVIAERGPIDFLAYLLALDRLGRPGRPHGSLDEGVQWAQAAAAHIDLLLVLPIDADAEIRVADDEDAALRDETDQVLLELIEQPDLTGPRVVEIAGSPATRLSLMERVILDAPTGDAR
ncbi:AAA family ATPase [Microbacterium sp. NPDC057650]|uniref:AAA family ATPase n=1 Tax=unclassified Microbacterium TaxID=2609290 RepID=UPI0036704BA0